MTITIELSEETANRLQEAARRRNMTATEYAAHGLEQLLAAQDKVMSITRRVIEEDAELLRRLA